MSDTLRTQIEAIARRLGFSAVRVAKLTVPTPSSERFQAWIKEGYHGEMHWMVRGLAPRRDPTLRLPDARSVLVLATDHHADVPPDPRGLTGRVARYAWGRDYHNLIGKRLKKLKRALSERGLNTWGGVDTAPVLERAWAQLAGLGYLGKNTLSIVPSRGSYYFLSVLFLDAELPSDQPLPRSYCGRCTRCLVACPTQAFPSPHLLDATRCISYWTIEAYDLPPRSLRPHFGRWIFGCDVCQEVCPHNHRPPSEADADLAPRHAWLDLPSLILAEDQGLMERFTGTPLRRPKAAGLKRNALLALGNLGDPAGVPAATYALQHTDDRVRAAAVWALHRLAPARVPDADPSPTVQAEIDAGPG